MAVQFYNSPFRVLGITPETCNADTLQQLRKQLLAEFELQQDKTEIEWNGTRLDKQQAMALTDELKDGVRLGFHKRIHADDLLLHFLERGEAAFLFHTALVYYEPAFIEFCSPFIQARLSDMLASAFECNDLVLLTVLLQPHPLITAETAEASLFRLRALLSREKEEMDLVRRKSRYNKESIRISTWTQHVRSGALDKLPFSLSHERDLFIRAFVALLWLIPDEQIRVSEKARLLDQMQQITVSEKALHKITELRSRLSFASLSSVASSRGTGIMLGLPLILLLVWIAVEASGFLYKKMTAGDVEGLKATATFFYWVYVCVMIGVTMRHVFQVLRAKSWIWIVVLVLLNVVAMPLYWALFMRHPKDKISNRIGLALVLIVAGLVLLVNIISVPK